MWRLLHALMGWEYVVIENTAASYVRRIWWRGDTPMISAYPFQHWPLIPPYHGWTVEPLTEGAAHIVDEFKTRPQPAVRRVSERIER